MVRFRVVAVLLAFAAVTLGAAPAAAAPRAVVTVAGGDTHTNAGGRCTLGFNVTGRGILAGAAARSAPAGPPAPPPSASSARSSAAPG